MEHFLFPGIVLRLDKTQMISVQFLHTGSFWPIWRKARESNGVSGWKMEGDIRTPSFCSGLCLKFPSCGETEDHAPCTQ